MQADGNVSLIPVVQREDPDLTVYEDISQILLNEDMGAPSAKQVKVALSSQPESDLNVSKHVGQENEQQEAEEDQYLTMNPDDVSKYLHQVENVGVEKFGIEVQTCYEKQDNPNVQNMALIGQYNNVEAEVPKFCSTPVNGKVKRSKLINPEDIVDMEVKRADVEAAPAIKEAADKISDAAAAIINCMQELKPEIKSLANMNYREIQMSTNAVKQLVSAIV